MCALYQYISAAYNYYTCVCCYIRMSEWGYVIAILQDDDGGMDEEYDDAWVQVHNFYLTLIFYLTLK